MGSLSARCSVIACANPSTGHYNRSRTILENIRISNAILSRFDLVFLMLDDPDLQRDKKLSEHVMRLHSRNRKRKYDDFMDNSSSVMSQSVEPNSGLYPGGGAGGTSSAAKSFRSNGGGGIMGDTDMSTYSQYGGNREQAPQPGYEIVNMHMTLA